MHVTLPTPHAACAGPASGVLPASRPDRMDLGGVGRMLRFAPGSDKAACHLGVSIIKKSLTSAGVNLYKGPQRRNPRRAFVIQSVQVMIVREIR